MNSRELIASMVCITGCFSLSPIIYSNNQNYMESIELRGRSKTSIVFCQESLPDNYISKRTKPVILAPFYKDENEFLTIDPYYYFKEDPFKKETIIA